VLATATDDQTKEETQNIKTGRRVTVSLIHKILVVKRSFIHLIMCDG